MGTARTQFSFRNAFRVSVDPRIPRELWRNASLTRRGTELGLYSTWRDYNIPLSWHSRPLSLQRRGCNRPNPATICTLSYRTSTRLTFRIPPTDWTNGKQFTSDDDGTTASNNSRAAWNRQSYLANSLVNHLIWRSGAFEGQRLTAFLFTSFALFRTHRSFYITATWRSNQTGSRIMDSTKSRTNCFFFFLRLRFEMKILYRLSRVFPRPQNARAKAAGRHEGSRLGAYVGSSR